MEKIKEVIIYHSTYIIRANDIKAENYHVNLEIFRSVGECYSEEGVDYDPPRKCFPRKGETNSLNTTYDLADAQRVLQGYIKWDGCSDIDFFPDHGGNEHFCGKPGAVGLGALIDHAYEFAREIMGDKVLDDCFYDL